MSTSTARIHIVGVGNQRPGGADRAGPRLCSGADVVFGSDEALAHLTELKAERTAAR